MNSGISHGHTKKITKKREGVHKRMVGCCLNSGHKRAVAGDEDKHHSVLSYDQACLTERVHMLFESRPELCGVINY